MNLRNTIIYTVRIIKSSHTVIPYWYHDKIGQEFKCTKHINDSMFWPTDEIFKTLALISDGAYAHHGNILPEDCEILHTEENLFDYNQNSN